MGEQPLPLLIQPLLSRHFENFETHICLWCVLIDRNDNVSQIVWTLVLDYAWPEKVSVVFSEGSYKSRPWGSNSNFFIYWEKREFWLIIYFFKPLSLCC